jgi:hypothetical protein
MKKKAIYRTILENYIGRPLLSTEIVHHRDGDQHNNDISNLEITSIKTHLKKPHLSQEDWEQKIKKIIEKDINITAKVLNDSLDTFFTSRQKEIILQKVLNNNLSKTEREYFSRIIKKKIRALASPRLFEIAQTLLLEL